MVDAVHDHVIAVGIVDGLWRKELHGRNMPDVIPPAGIDVLSDHFVDADT